MALLPQRQLPPAQTVRQWRRAAVFGADLPLVSEKLQDEAYRQVIAGGPRRIPPATHMEWQLRQFPPTNFVHR